MNILTFWVLDSRRLLAGVLILLDIILMRSSHWCIRNLSSILGLGYILFFNWRLLLIVHTGTWRSFICWCTARSTSRAYNHIGITSLSWYDLAACSLHSITRMKVLHLRFWRMLCLAHLVSLMKMTESSRMLAWRMWTHLSMSITWILLLRAAIGNLDWPIPEGLENWFWISCWGRLLLLRRVFGSTIDLLHWVAVSDHHTMIIWKHIVMEMTIVVLTHSHWRLWRLWTDFRSSLRSSILLKLWWHLILARVIMRMLVIRRISDPCIHLMCSNMSAWSPIVMRRMVIDVIILTILWNLFRSRTWSRWTIYSVWRSIRTLIWLLFLAQNSTMGRLLGAR